MKDSTMTDCPTTEAGRCPNCGHLEQTCDRVPGWWSEASQPDSEALDLADFANAVKGRCEISGDHYVYPRSVPRLIEAAKKHGIALAARA